MKALGHPISLAVAAHVKRARLAAKLNQRELAARLKWDDAKIVLIEKGQQQLRIAEFVVLFEELGEDPLEILRKAMSTRPSRTAAKGNRE